MLCSGWLSKQCISNFLKTAEHTEFKCSGYIQLRRKFKSDRRAGSFFFLLIFKFPIPNIDGNFEKKTVLLKAIKRLSSYSSRVVVLSTANWGGLVNYTSCTLLGNWIFHRKKGNIW